MDMYLIKALLIMLGLSLGELTLGMFLAHGWGAWAGGVNGSLRKGLRLGRGYGNSWGILIFMYLCMRFYGLAN